MDREKVIRLIEEEISVCESVNQCYRTIDLPALHDILAVIKEQDQMYYTLEHDWRMCRKLLKEQEAIGWINVKDKLPEKDGQYLVVYTFFNYKGMGVVRFSHNLHEVDEYIFNEENRPGWYEPDDEVGYFERTTVTHWAKLPEFPKEGR